MAYILAVFFVTMAFTGFVMEILFEAFGIIPDLAGGQTATEQTYFAFDYVFYLNLLAFSLSGFLLYVYRRGLGAPGKYRDPVCGMRVAADGPSATHDGETYQFCSATCRRAFEENPARFAQASPKIAAGSRDGHH